MNFNENDLWRDKTKLLNFRFSKLHSTKVLLKLEFDTKDQVLSLLNSSDIKMVPQYSSATIFMSVLMLRYISQCNILQNILHDFH